MTLVLALHSTEGIVLASDSQVTFTTSGQHVRSDMHKIQCPWKNVAWARPGTSASSSEWRKVTTGSSRGLTHSPEEVRPTLSKQLTDEVTHVLRPLVVEQYLNVPDRPWNTDFLFAGFAQGNPFIVTVETNLVDTDHMPTGFCAIGSGDIFAYAGLSHFEVRERSLLEAKLIAHRVLSDAIKVAAFGLSGPVEMIELALEGDGLHCDGKKLDEADVKEIEDTVEAWKLGEAGFLTEFIGAPPPVPT